MSDLESSICFCGGLRWVDQDERRHIEVDYCGLCRAWLVEVDGDE